MTLNLLFWHWWVFTLIFTVIEAVAPSGLFAALSLSSAITGGVAWAYEDVGWSMQLGLFALSTAIIYAPISAFLEKRRRSNPKDEVNSSKQLIGTELTLTNPIVNGFCEIDIDGTIYTLKGPALRVATKVRIVGTDGTMLVVHPVTPPTIDTTLN